jgi:hypothetical protein
MNVLAKRCPGLLHVCSDCGALLSYTIDDIYENQFIYCPICKCRQKTNLDLSYDGVVVIRDRTTKTESK